MEREASSGRNRARLPPGSLDDEGVTVTPLVSTTSRDVIYERLMLGLSAIGDIWIAALNERFDEADLLARNYADDLQLVVNDLGWGVRPHVHGGATGWWNRPETAAITFTTSPPILRRVFQRLADAAASERKSEKPKWDESRELEQSNGRISKICNEVLAELGAEGPG